MRMMRMMKTMKSFKTTRPSQDRLWIVCLLKQKKLPNDIIKYLCQTYLMKVVYSSMLGKNVIYGHFSHRSEKWIDRPNLLDY